MIMGKREFCKERRSLHQLGWSQLCKLSTLAGKDVWYLQSISSDKGKDVEDVEIFKGYHELQQFQDVLPAEILELPPHIEVDFSIKLVPGVAPALKEPYRMSTLELIELKLQLKEMLDKGYIRPSVSP